MVRTDETIYHVIGKDPDPPIPIEWAVGEDLLNIYGNYGNFFDSLNRIVYTPALPGAPKEVYDDWMNILRNGGTRHIPFGPIGGNAYPGIGWDNPDGYKDPVWFRAFVEQVLNTPASDGKGMRPILFLGGDTFNNSHIDEWEMLAKALTGLHKYLIVVPGWELVPGQWSSFEYSKALKELHYCFPESYLMVHFQPRRWVGSSNPVEPDDPWQGGEADFYYGHGGQFVDIVGYQTPHGNDLRSCDCPNRDLLFGHEDYCYLNRWEDGVARCGTGYHGWRVIKVCAFETIVWELFHSGWDANRSKVETERIRAEMLGVAKKWNCQVTFGNGTGS